MRSLEKNIKKNIKTIPNFPKKGIMFRDITSLISNEKMFTQIIDYISLVAKKNNINKIVGIDARGFIFAAPVAYKNKIPLILIRKKGKLPGNTFKAKYSLEYDYDEMEIHKNSIKKDDNIMIVDDLIATGGTALAAAKLVKKTNSKKINYMFIVELNDLPGMSKLIKLGHQCTFLSSFSENEK
mgnify:CR=1 FL=1